MLNRQIFSTLGGRPYIASLLTFVMLTIAIGVKLSTGKLLNFLWTAQASTQLMIYAACALVVCIMSYGAAFWVGLNSRLTLTASAGIIALCMIGIVPFLTVLSVIAGAFVVGITIWNVSNLTDRPPAGLLVAIGLAVFGILLTISASFPINNKSFYSLVLLLSLSLILIRNVRNAVFIYVKNIVCLKQDHEGRRNSEELLVCLGDGALIIALGIQFLYVLLPERYFDAMVTHLYIASFMEEHNRWMFDVNTWSFAHMPLTIDFIYSMFFGLQGEESVRLYNFSVLILNCLIVLRLLEKYTSRVVAIWVVVLLSTLPLSLVETASIFIENTLALWILSAVSIVALTWSQITLRHSLCVLILLSAAVMSKLHGVIAAGLIGILLLISFIYTRHNARSWFIFGAMVIFSVSAASLPYAHAFLDTGNPIFPFANHIFKSPLWPAVAFEDPRWTGRFHWGLLWDATFRSSSYIEGRDGVLGIGPLLLFPTGVVAVCSSRRPAGLIFLFVCVGYLVLVASQMQYLRYFYILAPCIFILMGIGLQSVRESSLGRILVIPLVGATVLLNIYLMPSAGWILREVNFTAAFNDTTRRSLELSQIPERIVNRLINEIAGGNARVFYTGFPLAGLLQGTSYSATWYNTIYFRELSQATEPNQIRDLMRRMAITYVVHDSAEPTAFQKIAGQHLKTSGRVIAQIGNLEVYQLYQ